MEIAKRCSERQIYSTRDGTDQIGVIILMQICNREEAVSSLGRCIITTVTVPLPYTYFPNNGLLMIMFGTIFLRY